MGAIYRFDLVGKNGGTMGGHIFGEYTVEQALAWAFDDIDTGRAVPVEIVRAFEDGGGVAYDAEAIQTAYASRPLPPELLARLAAVGAAWTGQGPSRWGSFEILTPAPHPDKYMWCTPAALVGLLEEWEALGGCHPRLALIFKEAVNKG